MMFITGNLRMDYIINGVFISLCFIQVIFLIRYITGISKTIKKIDAEAKKYLESKE